MRLCRSTIQVRHAGLGGARFVMPKPRQFNHLECRYQRFAAGLFQSRAAERMGRCVSKFRPFCRSSAQWQQSPAGDCLSRSRFVPALRACIFGPLVGGRFKPAGAAGCATRPPRRHPRSKQRPRRYFQGREKSGGESSALRLSLAMANLGSHAAFFAANLAPPFAGFLGSHVGLRTG